MPLPTIQTLPLVNPLIANPCKRLLTVEDYTLIAADKQFLFEEDPSGILPDGWHPHKDIP
jgi:hypothetical protein